MSSINPSWEESFSVERQIGTVKGVGNFFVKVQGASKAEDIANELFDSVENEISDCRNWHDIDALNSRLEAACKRLKPQNLHLKVRAFSGNKIESTPAYVASKIFVNNVTNKKQQVEIAIHGSRDDLRYVEKEVNKLIADVSVVGKKNLLKRIAKLGKKMDIDIRASLKPISERVAKVAPEEEAKTAGELEPIKRMYLTPPSSSAPASEAKSKIDENHLSPRWKGKGNETRR